jgi:acetyl esterase/lipase
MDGYVTAPSGWVCQYRDWQPDVRKITYTAPGGLNVYLDVYRPSATGTFPALIMIHGGGWRSGCRKNVSQLARDAADSQGYFVYSVDYRLACMGNEPGIDNEIKRLCGYYSNNPVVDIREAIKYVRLNGHSYEVTGKTWNGKVAVLGYSAGGNLALMAAVTGTASNNTLPDVAGAWSGPTELALLSDDATTACDLAYGPQVTPCKNARAQYVDCVLFPVVHGSDCEIIADYASPWHRLDIIPNPAQGVNVAPVFIANATDELTPNEEAEELDAKFFSEGIERELCITQGDQPGEEHNHATGLKDEYCNVIGDSTKTVSQRTFIFFDLYV